MNKYNKGDIVRIRRYKDLCCEFKVYESGDIVSGDIFHNTYIKYCGNFFMVSERTKWGDDYAYILMLPANSNWYFKDYLLEDHVEEVVSK